MKHKGIICGILSAICYGIKPFGALPLYEEGVNTASVLFYRFSMAIVILFVMLLIRKKSMRVKKNEMKVLASLGILMAIASITFYQSFHYMDAGIASTILFMYPVMVALLMALCFHERASLLTWVCIAVAVAGVLLLTRTSEGAVVSTLGITFVLLSSLSYAIYIVGVNRSSIARMPSAKLTFYALCFGILIYITRTRALTDLQLPQSALGWTCAFCLALFPTIISLVTMTISIRNIGSTSAAILGALEPITALLVGSLVFGERLTPRLCVGIVLVLLAVTMLVAGKKIYYVTLRKLRRSHDERKSL